MKNPALKKIFFLLIFSFSFFVSASEIFNSKMSDYEISELKNGEVLIRNIEFYKNMSLDASDNFFTEILRSKIKKLSPKYLVEVIKFIPYEGMENLPERLEYILNNVSDYVGIPYWSVESEKWYELFTYAEIKEKYEDGDKYVLKADLEMDPFDIICERIEVSRTEDSILYLALNENKLSYHKTLDCIWPQRMLIALYVFRDYDSGNWVMYGIGGVRAPRFPIFHKRISVSFENRIKTLCLYFIDKL